MVVPRISPTTEAEIADAVREAAEKGSAFEIIGAGTKREFGRPASADAILDVSALSGILKYEPEELVLTARAATPIAEIQTALADKRQMLAFEPADWGPLFGHEAGRATLAGVVATNACGSRRVKAGAVRDSVIGCRFVNGRGDIAKAGGHVIKNVTGFDLPKLMCGAFGTLGVLTEITLRVSPLPERVAAVAVRNCEAQTGLGLLRRAAQLPVDPTGLTYLPRAKAAYIRVEGTSAALAEKLKVLREEFASQDCATLDDQETAALFADVSDVAAFRAADAVWRLCVAPADASAAIGATGALDWYADWAGGLVWLDLPGNADPATRLRGITARFGGHATLMRASRQARETLDLFEPESPVRGGLTRGVKTAFDPKRVLNPGRMYKNV
jgi:glycolate oxidase FAD binding subunit